MIGVVLGVILTAEIVAIIWQADRDGRDAGDE